MTSLISKNTCFGKKIIGFERKLNRRKLIELNIKTDTLFLLTYVI